MPSYGCDGAVIKATWAVNVCGVPDSRSGRFALRAWQGSAGRGNFMSFNNGGNGAGGCGEAGSGVEVTGLSSSCSPRS